MSDYYTVLTNVGADVVASAIASNQPINIKKMAIGTGGGPSYNPTAEQLKLTTTLVDEVDRFNIVNSGAGAEQGTYFLQSIIPIDKGGYTVREAGWLLENGTLFAVTKYPPTEKTTPNSGSGIEIPIKIFIKIDSAANINVVIDDSNTYATIEHVADKDSELKELADSKLDKNATAKNTEKLGNQLPAYYAKNEQVLTDVPANAKFTDTNTHRAISNSLTSASTTTSASSKAVKDLKGLVDSKAPASKVLTQVPANAKFTDTNTHRAISSSLTSSSTTTSASSKAVKDLKGLVDSKAPASKVLTQVPANAKFTDTNTHRAISSSLTSSSTTTSASSKAVKDLKDSKLDNNAKAVSAITADKLNNLQSSAFGRAFSSSYGTGGGTWKTADFITWLNSKGAFYQAYWVMRGSWSYSTNRTITDSGVGLIGLAGSVIEVMGRSNSYTIRVTTPTTSSGGGVVNTQFTYVNNGNNYHPGWRRDYNTSNKPTLAELGAAPASKVLTQVPANAKFTDTNTHRAISNSLTSTSTTTSASSKAAKDLKRLVDSKAPTSHAHNELRGHNYISGGQEKPTYFGANKLRYQMLNMGGWCDTLWVSSYGGGDVKLSNQIVMSKSGRPRIGFRQQNYDSDKWGGFIECYTTSYKPTPAAIGALPKTAKAESAKTADKLGGAVNSTSAGGYTIAQRDSSGDVHTRLVRSNYQNESRITGGIVFRVNTTDNYHRVCTSQAAIVGWLKSALDSKYLGKTAKAASASTADKLGSSVKSTSAQASTIAQRDSSGDLHARFIRTTYGNQSTIKGAMAFRYDDTNNNHVRFCSNTTAIVEYLESALSAKYQLKSSGGGGGGGGGGCFGLATKTLLKNGELVPLISLKIGDEVAAKTHPKMTDESSGNYMHDVYNDASLFSETTAKVVAIKKDTFSYYYLINNNLEVTFEHPLLIKRSSDINYQWEQARNVRAGDSLIDNQNNEILISSIQRIDEQLETINIDVESVDNFYVQMGEQLILAHNIRHKD